MTRLLPVLLLLALPLFLTGQTIDPDSDGDGLSDFQETHKYFTNPSKADSDGDGVPDGQWRERREYAYTIRSVIQVMPSYDKATLNDDYQDCQILFECPEYIELEVVHYPLNTCATSIRGDKNWRVNVNSNAKLAPFLAPGPTTNWDKKMQADLHQQLRKDGIDVALLDDKEVVERVSAWACRHAKSFNRTCVWAVGFKGDTPVVLPTLAEKFEKNLGKTTFSAADQFEHELFGKGMYDNQTRGTCTTSANYLATVLRAVGIPSRCIVTIPVVDGSDSANVRMLKKRLKHGRVRRTILAGVKALGNSFAAHTYNEVWVGGRWRRLNYSTLGQSTLDANYMGLMTRVHTFLDLAHAGLGDGWGIGRQRESDVFRRSNPYTALTVNDEFGIHSGMKAKAHRQDDRALLNVTNAYWFDSDENRPASIEKTWRRVASKDHGHILLHVEGDGIPFIKIHDQLDATFKLTAKGEDVVWVESWACIWEHGQGQGAEFYLRIPPSQFKKMRKGKAYALHARNQGGEYKWVIRRQSLSRRTN
ncbi:MAG: hypothetical protein ACI97A_002842 [Planctomycetota bacterium]|jgi:hypothetical protein